MEIIQADIEQLEEVAGLFNDYRVFYEQEDNLEACRIFIKERMELKESVIFLAVENGVAVGFTQLYPMFSSVSMQRMNVLNDLYVKPEFRGKKIGEAILKCAQNYAQQNNLKGLLLETASDNPAQRLYEKLGWTKDEGFYHYFWKV